MNAASTFFALFVLLTTAPCVSGVAAEGQIVGKSLSSVLHDFASDNDRYVAGVGSDKVGVVCGRNSDTSAFRASTTLLFREFDASSGKLLLSVDLVPQGDKGLIGVHDPVFTVASDGNIHIFWLSVHLDLYGAIVDGKGHIQFDPHSLGAEFQSSVWSFCAQGLGDKVCVVESFTGYINAYSGSGGGANCSVTGVPYGGYHHDDGPISSVLVMDGKHKLLHDYSAKNVLIHKEDAIAMDSAGRIHLVFNNSDQVDHKPGESVIERVTLGPDGKEEERHEVGRVHGLWSNLAVTPDPQGNLRIYYIYGETDKPKGEIVSRLGHITEKCKEPAKGVLVPTMLISAERVYRIDKSGVESSVSISQPKRPSRRPAK
jgi:hypothetical protein